MAKRRNARKILEEMFEITRSRATSTSSQHPSIGKNARRLQRRTKSLRKLARRLAKPVGKAFERSGLDPNNEKHWGQLLVLMAFAIYGGRGRGQPKQWSNKNLRRLLAAVTQVKDAHPSFDEKECCEYLIKKKVGKYKGKGSTLRRKLQDAKKLDETDQLIAASGDDPVISAVTKDLKTHT